MKELAANAIFQHIADGRTIRDLNIENARESRRYYYQGNYAGPLAPQSTGISIVDRGN